jgi:penicillin-binding protein 1C
VVSGAAGLAFAVYAKPYPLELLSPDRGGPVVLTDRHGQVLRSVPHPEGRPGRQAWVPLEDIPGPVVSAVLASEDERFFDHAGVDPLAVLRAVWLNVRGGRLGYGASTLTMQLVKTLHHPGEERTLGRKLTETVLALRLERATDKRTILEQYLNRVYYGNGAYGIEAAARRYFDKPAEALSPGEATLLSVLPRSPAGYDPIRHLDRALERRDHVLSLMVEDGALSRAQADRARAETLAPALHQPPFRARHFTAHMLRELPAELRQRGGTFRTTLDLTLQKRLEDAVERHVASLEDRDLDQAGAVVLDTETGDILAFVGSKDFDGESGQLDIVTWRRHPGSALKPFVYAAAIEAGDSPASIAYDVYDVPSAYRVRGAPPPEHGPVRYRAALASSYNLAAVHTLERVGVRSVMNALESAGVASLSQAPEDYGLRLALGSAKVRLLDLTAGYRAFVREGRVRAPRSLLDAELSGDRRATIAPARERAVFSPETSWLVMDMMADADARRPEFGAELPLDLPFSVAAKTGTSRGFADTVTVAATNEVLVGAWAGNFDGRPTEGLVAMESAAPIVRAALVAAASGHALTLPPAPDSIVRRAVCPLSGMRPGPSCPHRMVEHFTADAAPEERCDWHTRDAAGELQVRYPAPLRAWAERKHRRGGRELHAAVRTPP